MGRWFSEGGGGTVPSGAPRGTRWIPITTFLANLIDLMNALSPTPGTFDEGGHDYRAAIPDAIRQTWRLEATDDQLGRMVDRMRHRELARETRGAWTSAQAAPDDKREGAEAKVGAKGAGWVGSERPLDPIQITEIVNQTGPAADGGN